MIVNYLLQNTKLSLTKVKQLDSQWRQGKQQALIAQLQSNDISKFLQRRIESSQLYLEAFICDDTGAIVGLFPKTTNYWQGDETKFTNSFEKGIGRVFLGPLIFDESTKTYATHISVPIRSWNKTIGVLIVGLRNIK